MKQNLRLKSKLYSNRSKNVFLRSYLAGLIEGDGSFYVPKKPLDIKAVRKNSKTIYAKQNAYPQIKICFPRSDYPLRKKLQNAFGGGFEWSKKKTYLVLKIQRIGGVYMVARLINGYMRTPKMHKFCS
jgi:hypothetical protein